jgi:phosphate starvation-inducible PhoH-like protein
VLRGVEGISFINFDERDVVRHNLVQRIVKAYEKYNELVGAGRQLTLRLADNTVEAPAGTAAPTGAASPGSTTPGGVTEIAPEPSNA